MIELVRAIASPEAMLTLEPEELGAKLLFLTQQREGGRMFHPGNYENELFAQSGRTEGYPRDRESEVRLAYVEAWSWLEAQGLVVPEPGSNGQNGFRRLSRRARRFQDEEEFQGFAAATLLPKSILHPSISEKVWLAFVRGDFDVAVFLALKQVEISVRQACGYGEDAYGSTMMRQAFHVTSGPLTDTTAVKSEREARQHLFAGVIGSYKNPQSHRDVNLDNPSEAIEVILIASHLLRIVDTRLTRREST